MHDDKVFITFQNPSNVNEIRVERRGVTIALYINGNKGGESSVLGKSRCSPRLPSLKNIFTVKRNTKAKPTSSLCLLCTRVVWNYRLDDKNYLDAGRNAIDRTAFGKVEKDIFCNIYKKIISLCLYTQHVLVLFLVCVCVVTLVSMLWTPNHLFCLFTRSWTSRQHTVQLGHLQFLQQKQPPRPDQQSECFALWMFCTSRYMNIESAQIKQNIYTQGDMSFANLKPSIFISYLLLTHVGRLPGKSASSKLNSTYSLFISLRKT